MTAGQRSRLWQVSAMVQVTRGRVGDYLVPTDRGKARRVGYRSWTRPHRSMVEKSVVGDGLIATASKQGVWCLSGKACRSGMHVLDEADARPEVEKSDRMKAEMHWGLGVTQRPCTKWRWAWEETQGAALSAQRRGRWLEKSSFCLLTERGLAP